VRSGTALAVAVVSLLALSTLAVADEQRLAARPAALGSGGCAGGQAIRPTKVISGEFDRSLQGSYVLVPFSVPGGTTQVRVKYCFDQPSGASGGASNTLDLGLYGPLQRDHRYAGRAEFRGWGGSSHPDVALSAQGFSSAKQYGADPKGYVPGATTRGFRPGPIEGGRWWAELGVAGVVTPEQGNPGGKVRWRLEIELRRSGAFMRSPYRPARYDSRPARSRPGWYAGDLHVHSENSALGDAPMRETFDYAFRGLDRDGAGLDFITLTDYVTDTGWGEVGRYQDDYPGKLIARGSEVITYRGHTNNQSSGRFVDYRTGPLYERRSDGSLVLRRKARPARAILQAVRRAGGWTQINHPTIFPSSNPAQRLLCRGCPWDYTAKETRFGLVDAIEVATGPAGFPTTTGGLTPNPFVRTAIDFYERALAKGSKIAAVGVSDSHHAGRPQSPIQAPIGKATTVVYADELSEAGIARAIRRGRTYVKLFGNDGPDLRFQARAPGVERKAIMGDTLRAGAATFTARVLGADPAEGARTLVVVKDGKPLRRAPVTARGARLTFPSEGAGRYRLELLRGNVVETVSSPIYLEP
jgi:hypothetical protein